MLLGCVKGLDFTLVTDILLLLIIAGMELDTIPPATISGCLVMAILLTIDGRCKICWQLKLLSLCLSGAFLVVIIIFLHFLSFFLVISLPYFIKEGLAILTNVVLI